MGNKNLKDKISDIDQQNTKNSSVYNTIRQDLPKHKTRKFHYYFEESSWACMYSKSNKKIYVQQNNTA